MLVHQFQQNRTFALALTMDVTGRNLPSRMAARNWVFLETLETKEAWIVDYRDLGGKKRLKTFDTRKEAANFAATTHIDIEKGIHIPDRTSVTVAQAGRLWLATNEEDELEVYSIKRNRQHLEGHIVPRIGAKRLNELNVPEVRGFVTRLHNEGVSKALAKMILTSLGSIVASVSSGPWTLSPPRRRPSGKHWRSWARR